MLPRVLVVTNRTSFKQAWQAAGSEYALDIDVCEPAEISERLEEAEGIVIDGDSAFFDEDEILIAIALAKSRGKLAATMISQTQKLGSDPDLVNEMCAGLLVNYTHPVTEMATRIERRLDNERQYRFEYLTLSPDGEAFVAIGGRSYARLLPRPLAPQDDKSDVEAIDLSDDAQVATISLQSGARLRLVARDLFCGEQETAVQNRIPSGQSDLALPSEQSIDGAALGPRLKAIRLRKGLTQAEVARRSGIHRPNIARVEAGRHTPSLDTLRRLADAIGVAASEILSGTTE